MIEFTLPAMSCGHCVKTVTRAVQQVDPAATVEIDLASHRLKIGSVRGAQGFSDALAEAGYPPQAAAAA